MSNEVPSGEAAYEAILGRFDHLFLRCGIAPLSGGSALVGSEGWRLHRVATVRSVRNHEYCARTTVGSGPISADANAALCEWAAAAHRYSAARARTGFFATQMRGEPPASHPHSAE